MSFICTRIKNHSHIFVLTPALQVEVACPGAKGYNSNHPPRQKNTHRPTNPQPSYEPPPPPPPPPYYSTRHTEARNSVKVEWQKKNETERRGRGEDPKPKKADGGGPRETLCY